MGGIVMELGIAEIEEAVNNIGQDIFNSTGGVEYFNVTVTTNGFCQIVCFVGIELWNSEDDTRPYSIEGDEDTREPIEEYLRYLLRKECAKIGNILI
jgi:hypothetical protein